jgi:carboxypeptidase Q
VVLFNNEETGLGGARAYAEQHRAELDRHVLALEMDHGTAPVFYQSVLAAAGPAADAAIRELGAALKPFGLPEVIRGTDHGADLGPLRAAGVPVAMLAQDSTPYFDAHHSADDTLDRVDAATLEQVTAIVTAFARAAASGKGDLGRVPPELRGDR